MSKTRVRQEWPRKSKIFTKPFKINGLELLGGTDLKETTWTITNLGREPAQTQRVKSRHIDERSEHKVMNHPHRAEAAVAASLGFAQHTV